MNLRVTIGYQVDFRPFTFDDQGPAGLAIERLRPALDAEGIDVTWVGVALEEQIPALLDGRIDVVAALGVTPERATQVSFGAPLVRTGGALFWLVSEVERGDAAPVRIVTPGAGPLVVAIGRHFPDAELMLVEDYPAALGAVARGEADAAALNLHVGGEIAGREFPWQFELPSAPFTEVDLAPACAPGRHDELLRRLAAHLRDEELNDQ